MDEPGRRPRRARRARWPFALAGAALALAAWNVFSIRGEEATVATPAPGGGPTSESPATAFEPSDWSLSAVAVVYAGTLVLLLVSCLALVLAYPASLQDVGRALRIAPRGPLLQTDPQGDLQAFRAEEDGRLTSYYWSDKSKGVVHIPIERAMKQLVNSGIAGFPRGQP